MKFIVLQITLLEYIQGTADQLYHVIGAAEVAEHLCALFKAVSMESSSELSKAKLHAIKNATCSFIFEDDGKIMILQ